MKKLNITNILIGSLIVILLWQNFFSKVEKQPVPVTITVPEKNGTTGQKIIERVVTQPIYITDTKETITVDSKWKEKYEKAKDSLEKSKLYLEAIKIKEYKKILVDNDTIQIKGFATTRGSLLDYTVDYKIKPSSFSYTPKIVKQKPKFSMLLGVEAGVPTLPRNSFILKGELGLQNKKGNGIKFGYDTQNTFYIGLYKNITIIK